MSPVAAASFVVAAAIAGPFRCASVHWTHSASYCPSSAVHRCPLVATGRASGVSPVASQQCAWARWVVLVCTWLAMEILLKKNKC